jgi:transposase
VSKAIEVITSVERRRRWSAAETERLVSASLESGASVSAVAREAGIHPSQLYGWRRQLLRQSQPTYAVQQETHSPRRGARIYPH